MADGFWYRVGRLGSSKYHHVPPLTGNWKGRVLAFITRHATGALLPAKFISASNVASLLAGRVGVPAVQFLVFDSIASLAWAASYVAVGYFLRSQVQWTVAHALRPSLVLLGTAAVWPLAVLLSRKFKRSLHTAALTPATILCCALTSRLTQLGLSMHSAQQQVLARMYRMVLGQAQVFSYAEVYRLLGATCAVMFLLCFLLAKNKPGAGDSPSIEAM